eukprot:TRINITY_DN34639_c0_g1_i1.p1 TRINITY_DN34639_c0_g1~~TRINITY_DN34639_c0_g1_i1.p1  ORF type:complete len:1965 (+),score=368.55 TRINITY_DN34639_c0_g1_i1:571-5895(+)
MVADRSVGQSIDVDETTLLGEALGDLHAELCDGFARWRSKLSDYGPAGIPEKAEGQAPMVGGADWEVLPHDGGFSAKLGLDEAKSAAELSTQLAEMVTYLLVWGEAGNIRFMPEVVYFITELALAADPGDLGALYSADMHDSDPGVYRSGQFLSSIVRPIYNVVFDEWYEHVDVDQSNQKDKKKLHPGLDDFLPPDVANYDDWNELFCDPSRMVEGILLQDGTHLFDLPHNCRFAALSRVDWQVSLEAAETKTHREVHSLWGAFATTHRVWLLHLVLFFAGVCTVTPDPSLPVDGERPLLGQERAIRFAAVGLIVPIHALLWNIARWQVTGRKKRQMRRTGCGPLSCASKSIFKLVWWSLPVVSYLAVRDAVQSGDSSFLKLPKDLCLIVHYSLCGVGLFLLLFLPSDGTCNLLSRNYNLWKLTPISLHARLVRYGFWTIVFSLKFMLGLIIFNAIYKATEDLHMSLPGHESAEEISSIYYSVRWGADVLIWFVLWFTTFFLFVSDTQLWFTIICAFLGVATVFVQRSCRCMTWATEDAIAKIPENFSRKVLPYSYGAKDGKPENAQFSPSFPVLWDRILEYMRYEDKIDNQLMGDLSFATGEAGHNVYWKQLNQPLGRRKGDAAAGSTAGSASATAAGTVNTLSTGQTRRRVKIPNLFRENTACEMWFKTYCCVSDAHCPNNSDVKWRLQALSRGLGLPMPRPFQAPYFPGITVLIPHYGESILMLKKELFQEGRADIVPLMDWLKTKYAEEFHTFSNRMQVKHGGSGWPVAGSQWEDYTDQQWDKICAWASMRMQTLWRTVGGMCLYHPALQLHYEAQAYRKSKLADRGVWDPSDCFTCLVSMQMYKFFDKVNLEHTNRMFEKFPDCLKVAFIDCEDKGITSEVDNVHHKQKRRYFSSLIDRKCPVDPSTGMKKPKLRIELPGYPILGDGKGDNQNHAIPFMRGPFSQCIDANQGAYFEQMMLLPCALGEFRSHRRGDGLSKRIVGFPEHITSDIGSIGDFAASAEVAFGTILQRTYSVLGGRMHYGHPDIMNKLYMMQQGGVSKATKTVNLSEDIFAGMDFTLRGEERRIKHSEYFHLAKGRDLGFNTVLGFFSKLSSGTGEQVLTRQAFRLGQVLHLPEALTFYYAHVGYYFTQFFVSLSMPMLVFVWLLVLLADGEGIFEGFMNISPDKPASAEVMARTIGVWFSWLLALFLVATSLPLFAEVWMETNFKTAFERFLKQMFTLSPCLFIFQSKVIGHYVSNEIRYGGATYVATGRGLPTERRPFIGEAADGAFKLKKVGGLYLDYANIAYYDGAQLLAGAVFIIVAGGVSGAGESATQLWWIFISLGLTIGSWLWAPCIFNPYQFMMRPFLRDWRCLIAFFFEDSGRHWVEWYDRTQLKKCPGLHRSMNDITFFVAFFFLAAWYATVNMKIEALTIAYAGSISRKLVHLVLLLPPIGSSLVYCVLLVIFEQLVGCSSIIRRRMKQPKRSKAKTLRLGTQQSSLGGAPHTARSAGPEVAAIGSPPVAPATEDLEAPPVPPPEEEPPESDEDLDSGEDDDGESDVAAMEDREVEPAPAPAPPPAVGPARMKSQVAGPETAKKQQCCHLGVPLAISSLLVVLFDLGETIYFIRMFDQLGWRNAFLAGLILKWGLLVMCLFLAEGLLKARCCNVMGCCGLPLQLWVRAHKMARDIFCSSLIFGAMVPLVLLNSLNEYLCPGCNAHQLLIYRDPGHLARKEAVVVDIFGDDADGWTAGTSSADLEASSRPGTAEDVHCVMPPVPPPAPEQMTTG